MDEKRCHCSYFSVFFDERGLAGSSCGKEKEDYNSLDCFGMGIIEQCVSLSFDGEDPARSKKAVCRNDGEIEKQSE